MMRLTQDSANHIKRGESGVTSRQVETTKYVVFRCVAPALFSRNIDKSHEKHRISDK